MLIRWKLRWKGMVHLLFWSPFMCSLQLISSTVLDSTLTLSFPIHLKNKCCSRQHKEAQTWASIYGNWAKSHGDHLLTRHIPLARPQSFISFCFSFFRLSKANTITLVCTETSVTGPWSWFKLRIIKANMNLASLILNLIQFCILHIEKAFPELYHKQSWVEAQSWARAKGLLVRTQTCF